MSIYIHVYRKFQDSIKESRKKTNKNVKNCIAGPILDCRIKPRDFIYLYICCLLQSFKKINRFSPDRWTFMLRLSDFKSKYTLMYTRVYTCVYNVIRQLPSLVLLFYFYDVLGSYVKDMCAKVYTLKKFLVLYSQHIFLIFSAGMCTFLTPSIKEHGREKTFPLKHLFFSELGNSEFKINIIRP